MSDRFDAAVSNLVQTPPSPSFTLSPLTRSALDDLFLQANRAAVITTLARGLTHELRNPLQALTLAAHAGETEGRMALRLAEAISRSVEQLAQTIQLFSLVSAPPEDQPGPLNVAEILAMVRDLQTFQRSLPAVEHRLRIDSGLPPGYGLERDLRHILLNLITNAKEAMTERPDRQIVVTARSHGGQVEIVVEDNGPGVPAEDWEVIFQPFYTSRAKTEGITRGLGLPVARRLAEMQGGSLTVQPPSSGSGGCFVLRMPRWSSLNDQS